MVENLRSFFADFGEYATWKGTTQVLCVFDKAYRIEGAMVEGTNPLIVAQAADMPGIAQDDAIVLRGVSYTIQIIEPDVTGTLLNIELEAV